MSRKYIALVSVLNKRLNHFPVSEQKGLVPAIRNKIYLMCDHMIDAQKRFHKMTPINNLDIAHEQLRMHLFVAKCEGYFSHPLPRDLDISKLTNDELDKVKAKLNRRRHEKLTVLVDEFGKLIGGWKNKIIDEDDARKEAAKNKKEAEAESAKEGRAA